MADDLAQHGATIVALTPQLPEHNAEMAVKNTLNFHLLSDPGNAYAAELGLRFEVPDQIKEIYNGFGLNLPTFNGDDTWTLPIPARIIVDTSGIVRMADIDADYPSRPEPSKTVADVPKEGYGLPPGYEWDEVDVETQEGRDEVFTLLANNYVEDDDEMFRFAYAPEFVSWALQPPGYEKSWHVGIRISCTKTLVALITGIPAEVSANGKRLKVAEINFLCVHKKLRRKNFAPVLIREVTRRINLKDVWQAAYTAGVVLPKPCAKARYWHRSINVKKLVDIRFTQLGRGMSMAETIEHYAMPKKIRVQGLRKMEAKDVPTVTRLLNSYFSKFKLAPVKNEEDVRHWLVPRDEVVYSYVKIDERTNEATDFCSFYNLSSTVIQASSGGSNAKRNNVLLKAAYCYYNVATSENIEDLVQDALILARDNGFDVFNALNVSENAQFLETLKFGIGDGDLHYYLYNWKLKETLAPKDVALVLL